MKGAKTILLMLALAAAGVLAIAQETDSRTQPPDESDAVTAPASTGRDADKPAGPDVIAAPVRSKTTPKSKDQSQEEDVSYTSAPSQTSDRMVVPSTPERDETAAPEIDHRPGGRPVDPDHPPRGGPSNPRPRHHDRHDEWRHRRYSHFGSWRFLWHFGPIIITPPHPPVVRSRSYRPKVYVRHTGSDVVGIDFAAEVRDELRDRGLRVVYSPTDATLELYLLSIEADNDDPGYNSAVSVSYIWQPGNKFITAQMLDVGAGEIDDLAGMVAEYADDLTDRYR